MNINNIISKVTNPLLVLFILCTVLPVKLNYSSISIIILLMLAIANFFSRERKINSSKKFLFLFGIPILIYMLGMTNSSNTDYGLNYISKNLSFIAFPIIFYSLSSWINQKLLLKSYLTGLSIINIYLWYLFIYYFNFGERFYMIVTTDIYHSTYLGMYNLLAYWICIYFFKKSKNKLYLLISTFYILSSVITSARIIFILSIISLLTTISLIVESKMKRVGIFLLVGIVSMTALITIPSIKQKFYQIVEINQIGFDEDNYQSISSRFGKIEAANTIIKKNLWFGTGTGDMMDELVEEYKKMKFTMGYKYRYNPHNQYLDNLARNGLIGGGICIIVIYLIPFYISIKKRDLLLGAFITIAAGVSMTESILDVHKGITFYVFFVTLLVNNERIKFNS